MSEFVERSGITNLFIHRMNEYYWNTDYIKSCKIINENYGYETHVSKEIMSRLRFRRSETAKFIRYIPDSILCDDNNEFLLEYKVTNTPRYTFKNDQWNRGQIEADAFENYLNLLKIDVQAAVVIYCPYHSHPLLCGIPKEDWIVGNRQHSNQSSGSGTPFYNVDLSKVSGFDAFMEQYFGIPAVESKVLVHRLLERMKADEILQTHHNRNSIYNTEQYNTGFNWEI